MAMYSCTDCGKQTPVAFRINHRNPSKISRATASTPKPLCIRCAETHRLRLLDEQAKSALANPAPEKRAKRPPPAEKLLPIDGLNVIELPWMYSNSYGKWRRLSPSKPGHYWVWAEGVSEPTLVHFSDTKSVPPTFQGKEAWFLGPLYVPPNPHKALAQYTARLAKIEEKEKSRKVKPQQAGSSEPAKPQPAPGKEAATSGQQAS
jgi:hypothetical protein